DSLLAFSAQTVRQQRKIEFTARAVYAARANRGELIVVNAFGVVQQPADQGALSIVYAARRCEAKHLLIEMAVEKGTKRVFTRKLRSRAVDLRNVSRDHQKYPSLFFSSMEPSSSWSIARFSRSLRRKPISSSMIFGRVSASLRMAPVHGEQPSDLIRTFIFSGRSCGSRRVVSSTSVSVPPRFTTSRSSAK